jgi:pectin methylesterase-like acyl-CoA thioesterase
MEALADVVVTQDGSDNFSITVAIVVPPQQSLKRHIIHVKKGVYDEIVHISNTTP